MPSKRVGIFCNRREPAGMICSDKREKFFFSRGDYLLALHITFDSITLLSSKEIFPQDGHMLYWEALFSHSPLLSVKSSFHDGAEADHFGHFSIQKVVISGFLAFFELSNHCWSPGILTKLFFRSQV